MAILVFGEGRCLYFSRQICSCLWSLGGLKPLPCLLYLSPAGILTRPAAAGQLLTFHMNHATSLAPGRPHHIRS